jgi:integrase
VLAEFAKDTISKTHVVYRGELIEGLKQTKRTGKLRAHLIGMSVELADALKKHKETTLFNKPTDYVFCNEKGEPIDPDHFRRQVLYKAMDKIGITEDQREAHAFGLHMFRHTATSEVHRELGLKFAQDQAGHSDISTTANIYTHIDLEQKLAAAKALGDVVGPITKVN